MALLVVTIFVELLEPSFLYSSLNPSIFLFLEYAVGSCQEATTLVDDRPLTVNLLGAARGMEQNMHNYDTHVRI